MRRRCSASSSARVRAVQRLAAGRNAMSNASNVGTSQHSLGEAIERLRGKWAAITAFGVLLVDPGVRGAVLFPHRDDRDRHSQRRLVPHRRRGRNRHRHAFARLGPVLSLGGRRPSLCRRRDLCIVNPLLASVVLTLLLGAGLIAAGVVRAYLGDAASGRPAPRAGLSRRRGHNPSRFDHCQSLAAGQRLCLGHPARRRPPFHGVGWVSFGMGLHSRA